MKLVPTEVKGSRRERVYDEAMPPLVRLKACKNISPEERDRLEKKLAELAPFALRETAQNFETPKSREMQRRSLKGCGRFIHKPEALA